MTFGQRLRNVVEGLHITQEEFANKIGVSRSILAKYFSDKSKPSIDIVSKISSVYANINSQYLISGEGEIFKSVETKTSKIAEMITASEPQAVYLTKLEAKEREIELLKELLQAKEEIIKQLNR